jgi:hypothetical protein
LVGKPKISRWPTSVVDPGCSQGAHIFAGPTDGGLFPSTTGEAGLTDEGIAVLHTATCEPNP